MATRAEAIDLLINKGRFEPQVALAVVEAVAAMMTEAQIVTVPVLDARVAEIRADIVQLDHKVDVVNTSLGGKIELCRTDLGGKIDRFKADLEAKIDLCRTELEAKIELCRTELEGKIDRVNANLEEKIDRVRGDLEGKIELLKAELGKLLESTKSELVRWVFLAMLGSGAIQAGAAALINAVQHH